MNFTFTGIISKGVPEANIQAEFYKLCRDAKIQVLLEITYKNCRFDAIVFRENKPFAIIEVKNYCLRRSRKGLNLNGRQMKKYKEFGLPIVGILNSKQIVPAFEKIVELLNKPVVQ